MDPRCADDWDSLVQAFENGEFYRLSHFPMQVHEVLIEHGVIENPNIQGINHDTWIHGKDWAYLCCFEAQEGLCSQLVLEGVDTYADVWLNGERIGCCDDVYLDWTYDVSGLIRRTNTLVVYFHAAQPIVDAIELPQRYQGFVPNSAAARIFRTGFHDYCGPFPGLIRCGLYGDVIIRQADPVEIGEVVCSVSYRSDENVGRVDAQLKLLGDFEGQLCAARLLDPSGQTAAACICAAGDGIHLQVDAPELWYPWTHGTPALYTLEVSVGEKKRSVKTGFREIAISEGLAFSVNGKPFRPWGVNLMHLDTLTNCYDEARMEKMLDLAQLANCNMIRIWGEADKLPDAFYESCDRRGILLWQDFYLGCILYSEEADFVRACAEEARQMIRARRHHPAIALWCGGNELYLAKEYWKPDAPAYFGETIIRDVFPQVCREEDPGRFYYASSPMGGRWANDPQGGDTHGYTHLWFVPGRTHPLFLSENCRVSTATYRSMQRMMTPEEMWPKGYHPGVTRQKPYEWPQSWNRHTPNEGWRKLGPVEWFYDAENAEQMVYRICAAHGEYIRCQVSGFRRGRLQNEEKRRTNGHLLWRLNDNCNVISFGVVDYFDEPGHAFYEMKRCYAPLFVSCELADHACVWLVNDSAKPVRGTVEVSLFHLVQNRVSGIMRLPFAIQPDESQMLSALDDFGQIRKENIICLRVYDEDGSLLTETLQPCDIERRLPYPQDTGLTISAEGDGVTVRCSRYARCVELLGDENGDAFGWVFEDNFFDLVPGTDKHVRILGRHAEGTIRAKAVFDEKIAECKYHKKG